MGRRVGDICYASFQEASDAYFSAQPAQFFIDSAGQYLSFVYSRNPDGSWFIFQYKLENGFRIFYKYSPVNDVSGNIFPECVVGATNSAMFNDGLSMGWGVVGAMFAALCIMFIAKALK